MSRSTTVSSQNNETSVPDVYFDTQCIIALPISKLQLGIHVVSVIVYPNVTNSEDDLRFGTKETVQFKIQKAFKETSICIPTLENDSILVDCEKCAVFPVMLCQVNATKNGKKFSSLDVRHQHEYIDAEHITYNSSCRIRLALSGRLNDSYDLTIRMYQGTTDSAANVVNFHFVFTFGENLTCGHSFLMNSLALTCSMQDIFPTALCRFDTIDKHVGYDIIGPISYSHVLSSQPNVSYESTCTVTVSINQDFVGQISILVTMYPDIIECRGDDQCVTQLDFIYDIG
ncbi:uncharacterized protein LOC106073728 isoform X1 [Biomphalaria glabrata]|uniref:Uncharacterized protein LOC106073728 isoform X1 n=1 Tax=Biomphalaria glabrata TaxID=6526 RepID=A0A9W2YWQ0_BIOGL|nr:uncharacterized protein LOC106073728 isoform X1 [Biomphalaria glabrata]